MLQSWSPEYGDSIDLPNTDTYLEVHMGITTRRQNTEKIKII